MLDVTAEQLVYVDESMFNQMTGWRHRAYAPIGDAARYHADRTRGRSWAAPACAGVVGGNSGDTVARRRRA